MISRGISLRPKPCARRVCIVNNEGTVLMDKFVRPKERITDFRTRYSGVRPTDLRWAEAFEDIQRQAAAILTDRIIVGHSISNDLQVPCRPVDAILGSYYFHNYLTSEMNLYKTYF